MVACYWQIEKLKAVQLHIIAAYHLTAFQVSLPGGSNNDDSTTRWSAGKIKAQNFLQMVFGMPDVVLAVQREGTRVGHFRKEARRQLIAACIALSDFVYGLKPLTMNQTHPTPPVQFESAIRSMVADGALPFLTTTDKTSFNSSHALQLLSAAPIKVPCELKDDRCGPATCVQTRGNVALSSGDDGVLAVWDVASCSCVHTLPGHKAAVTALAMFEVPTGGLHALSASRDETLKLWALESMAVEQPTGATTSENCDGSTFTFTTGHLGGVTCVAVIAGGFRAISGGADGSLRMWNLAGSPEPLCMFAEAHVGEVLCVAVFEAHDGVAMAVSGGKDGALKIWSLASATSLHGEASTEEPAQPHCELQGHESDVNCVHTFVRSEDGAACALSGDAAGDLRLWLLTSGQKQSKDFTPQCIRTLDGCLGSVWSCATFASGTKALSVSDDTCLRLWDLDSGECAHAVPGHPHREYGLAIDHAESLSQPHAVSAGDDAGSLKVWRLPCPPTEAFALHPASISSLLEALSPTPKARPRPAQTANKPDGDWEEAELALNLSTCFEE